MIQAANNINTKAMVTAKGNPSVDGEAIDPESIVEGNFAAELMANIQVEEPELKVSPLKISPDQLNNLPLQNNPEVQTDKINPKVFDPELTNGVDALVKPKMTMIEGEKVNPEINQALLSKIVQVQSSEVNPQTITQNLDLQNIIAPKEINPEALNLNGEVNPELTAEMALLKGEKNPKEPKSQIDLDSQILSGEDFISQKNLALKKNLNAATYGMKSPRNGAEASEIHGMMRPKLSGTELASVDSSSTGAGSSVNSQYFILGNLAEQGASVSGKEVAAPTKTFDLSQVKTSNPDQILNQVSDYIVQARAAKEPTVNLRMKHDDLGIIDITVHKANQEAISINIGAHSIDGKAFFQQNSKELVSHLTNAGLTVADMKVETSSQTAKNSGFDMNNNDSGRQGYGSEKNFGSEQNQRKHDSQRRQDLWETLYNKEAA